MSESEVKEALKRRVASKNNTLIILVGLSSLFSLVGAVATILHLIR